MAYLGHTALSGATSGTWSFSQPAGATYPCRATFFLYTESATALTHAAGLATKNAGATQGAGSEGTRGRVEVWEAQFTSAPTWPITFSGGSAWRFGAVVLNDGRDTAVPAELVTGASAASGSATTPATSGTASALADLVFFASNFDTVGTWTPPSGFTERIDAVDNTLATRDAFSGGATGSVTALNNNGTQAKNAILVSLAPLAAPGPAFDDTVFDSTSFYTADGLLLTGTPVDPVGVTDTAARDLAADRAQSDAAGVTDAAAATLATVRALADPVGATDSVTGLITTERIVTDPVGAADATSVIQSAARTQADPLGTTDSAATILAADRSTVDPVGVTDSVSGLISTDRTASDSAGVTDATTSELAAARTVGDPTAVTDNAATSLAATRTQADAIGATDSVTALREAIQSPADPVGATDTTSRTLDATRTQADAVGISDSVTADKSGAGAATLSDPVGVSDSVIAQLDRVRTVDDLLGLIDAPSTTKTAPRPQADPIGVTDSAVALLERVTVVTIGDVVGLADAALSIGRAIVVTAGAPAPLRYTAADALRLLIVGTPTTRHAAGTPQPNRHATSGAAPLRHAAGRPA